jgi:peptide chain release factor 3
MLLNPSIKSAGTVKGRKSRKHATSDWMEVGRQRDISFTSVAMQFEHEAFMAGGCPRSRTTP